MNSIRKNLFVFAAIAALAFGCDSQSGITDSNLEKFGSNGSGNGQNGSSGDITTQTNNLPKFLTYAVIGGKEVNLNGAPIMVRESTVPTLNANVHSNENVILNGNRITVKGFATYVENFVKNGDNINVSPNSNPNNKPSYYKVPKVNIPSISVSSYKSIADIVYDTDKQLSGNISLGTQSDPYIIYVTGNLYLDNVTFDGYGIVLAEKEIEIVSNVKSSILNPDHSKVLIIGGDKFKMNNSSTTLHAAVYAKNEINLNAEQLYVDGSLATQDKNTLNGDGITVRFKYVYSGLSEIIFGSN
jgi:hypothetical protein